MPGQVLRREVEEEVGLDIDNVRYLTSIALAVKESSYPVMIISCLADYASGDVVLQQEETDDFAWVSLEEAKEYDLIDGIYDELVMAERKLKGENIDNWQRFEN